jgi:hypothetical protein
MAKVAAKLYTNDDDPAIRFNFGRNKCLAASTVLDFRRTWVYFQLWVSSKPLSKGSEAGTQQLQTVSSWGTSFVVGTLSPRGSLRQDTEDGDNL